MSSLRQRLAINRALTIDAGQSATNVERAFEFKLHPPRVTVEEFLVAARQFSSTVNTYDLFSPFAASHADVDLQFNTLRLTLLDAVLELATAMDSLELLGRLLKAANQWIDFLDELPSGVFPLTATSYLQRNKERLAEACRVLILYFV